MKPAPAWRRYLRFFGADPAADVDDELQFHLETKIEELIAAGYPPRQARAEALRQFGPVRPIRRECARISRVHHSQVSRAEYFVGWLRDVRYAVRSLSRAKPSTIAAILILAAGIGATTAVFTLLDRLLLAPLPIPHPSQLLTISASLPPEPNGEHRHGSNFTSQSFENLRDHNQSLSGLLAESSLRVTERRGREKIAQPAEATAVSGNYFQVLALTAPVGRIFTPSDDPHVAVLSHRFWTSRFNQLPGALGRTIYLNDTPFTVIGILPRGFFGLHRGDDRDAYVPIAGFAPSAASMFRDGRWLRLFARLRPGVSPLAAQANLQTLAEPAERIEYADASAGTPGTWGEQRRSLLLLAAIVAVLLLMACANVACLLLARGAVRQQEMAIRLSLGAKRTRVLRQSLLESCLLSFAGGAAGLALAFVVERLLLAAFQWQSRPIDLSPDARMFAFAALVSLASAVLFGLVPALQLWRGGRLALARERTLTPKFGPGKILVVVEVALSLVLVAGAAVFIRSFQNLRAVPTGFSTDRVSVIALGSTVDPDSLNAPYREATALAESLRNVPGVEGAAVSDLLTFDDSAILYGITVPGQPAQSAREVRLLRIDGAYFNALHISMQTGRTFTARDDLSAPKVAILSEGTARRLFAGENPLGKRILLGRFAHPKPTDETEIVGIVSDIKFGSVVTPAPDVVFQPLLQGQNNSATTSSLKLHLRSRMSAPEVAALVRSRIRDMRLPVSADPPMPLEDAIAHSMLNDRIRMQASGIFGMLALLLITAGIYGLMAYSVALRTREIGIRMAIGSRPSEIVALVLRQGLRLTIAGVLLGLPAAVAVMKAISGFVFGLAPIDWASLSLASLVLCITGIVASVEPARRAARLDPVQALRVQ
jgi:putative ABC transport system permease protein